MRLYEEIPSLEGATGALNGEVNTFRRDHRPILVHFWAVSCPLCKKAMVNINEFRNRYEGQLQVVSVHMPRKEEDYLLENIRDDVAKYEIDHVTLIDGNHAIRDAFQNKSVPCYYLFDSKGQLRHMQVGGNVTGMLEKRLIRVLGEIG